MSEQILAAPASTRKTFSSGIAIGAAVVIVILALIALVSFLFMGRCPMCGRMMGH